MKNKLISEITLGVFIGFMLVLLSLHGTKWLTNNHLEYEDCKEFQKFNFCPKSNAEAVCYYFGEKSYVGSCVEFEVRDEYRGGTINSVESYYALNEEVK